MKRRRAKLEIDAFKALKKDQVESRLKAMQGEVVRPQGPNPGRLSIPNPHSSCYSFHVTSWP